MNKTKIQFLTHSWNPIAMRCTRVSDGCDNCWHIRMAKRHAGNDRLSPEVRAAKAGGPPILIASELQAPLRMKTPARIGVQFMGDLFHKDVPFEFIAAVFGVMGLAGEHDFQVLTKRPERLAEFCEWQADKKLSAYLADYVLQPHGWSWDAACNNLDGPCGRQRPLPNVQLGTSVENQAAVHRIEHLVRCPAAVRFLSLEPLLGDLSGILSTDRCPSRCDGNRCTMRTGHKGRHRALRPTGGWGATDEPTPSSIDWVIVGGESGSGARPMHPDWVRSIRDQCKAADVPFFFKQHGEWLHESQVSPEPRLLPTLAVHHWPDGSKSYRFTAKYAGNLLDGERHHEWPTTKET